MSPNRGAGPATSVPRPHPATPSLFLTAVLVFGLACQNYPRDPESTLDRARAGTLRVGVSESEPWITGSGGDPGGLEADLVLGFAKAIDADVEWIWGSQEEHMEALAKFELDLVAGGITATTPWKKKVGLTRPYLEERWVVGVPAGVPPPEDLDGLAIAVPETGPAGAWVKGKGARPVGLEDLEEAGGPVAAPEWRLHEMGYRPTAHELHTVKHVVAAPPGENELIVLLEEHLRRVRLRGDVNGDSP